jgi:hypothetical protein
MHPIGILQCWLGPLLTHIHPGCFATLQEAAASCTSGPALSLSDVGRRFAGEALFCHKVRGSALVVGGANGYA